MLRGRFGIAQSRLRERLAVVFGELERRVMEVVWSRKEQSVAAVHAQLGGSLAYTTVMTTLDRLYKKGVLQRHLAGRAYVYTSRLEREDVERSVASWLLEGALGKDAKDARPILSCIVDAVSERDRELLDELERLVRERQRRSRENVE